MKMFFILAMGTSLCQCCSQIVFLGVYVHVVRWLWMDTTHVYGLYHVRSSLFDCSLMDGCPFSPKISFN